MDEDVQNSPVPPEWIEALACGDADLVAGRTVPWAEARARLLTTQAELEAAQTRHPA